MIIFELMHSLRILQALLFKPPVHKQQWMKTLGREHMTVLLQWQEKLERYAFLFDFLMIKTGLILSSRT